MADYLFVYGTLLKGEANNSRLKGCMLEKYGYLPGKLYDTLNGYPAGYQDNGLKTRIYGEFYKLPENKEQLLESLDEYEGVAEKVFTRKELHLNRKKIFFYTLANCPRDGFVEIPSGSWLTYNPEIKNNPLIFARNFENTHKNYYRNNKINSIITIPGNSKILVSAPHATNHVRLSKLKRFEVYTATISVLLHAYLNTASIYSNSVTDPDPNYYDGTEYKELIKDYFQNEGLNFVLDIHGTGEEREADIYPGVGMKCEFLLGNDYILDEFYKSAEKYSIKCGSLDKFTASRQKTVTKFCSSKLGIASMQLEINKKYRQPDNNPENFNQLLKFLVDFLSKIKKRNE